MLNPGNNNIRFIGRKEQVYNNLLVHFRVYFGYEINQSGPIYVVRTQPKSIQQLIFMRSKHLSLI